LLLSDQLSEKPEAWLDEVVGLLAWGRLGHADLLTTSVILQSVGRLNDGWMRAPDGKRLPLPLLARIDDIWREGSQGRFGFARQLALQNRPPAGAPPGGGKDFFALADRLRWRLSGHELIPRRYSQFIASTRYPYGYPDAFFPTLRNVQVEESMGWLDQWRQSVMAIHVRLRREGGPS
jgi:hypothetical protein